MARTYNGSSEYTRYNLNPAVESSYTFSIWAMPLSNSANQAPMGTFLWDSNNGTLWIEFSGAEGGDPVRGGRAFSSSQYAASTSAYSINTWRHACFTMGPPVRNTATIYLDGANSATSTGDPGDSLSIQTSMTLGCTQIGASRSLFFSGYIQAAAIWGDVLGSDEIVSLAKGFPPRRVRPQSLLIYAPTVREVTNVWGKDGYSLNADSSTASDGYAPRTYGM